jgi:YebC/PmpR family DNA-binding regulatory protein
MSGHSKWATTKHKKAANDAKRAKLFAKLIKNIEVASRLGGPDLDGNPTLYDAVQKAKKNSLPADNIDRAIKRGAGIDGAGVEYTTIMYEGYAAGGVAVLIECLTDNKNRAAAEVRLAMSRSGGSMADPGSVSYQFARKGVILLDGISEEEAMEAALDDGIEEIESNDTQLIITTEPQDMVKVRTALQAAGLDYESADVEFVSSMKVTCDKETATKAIKLVDALEDLDDVQSVFTNMEIPSEVLEQLEAS